MPTNAAILPQQFLIWQRPRIAVARSLLARPNVLICDEPTSALDVSIQAQVLNLLKDLQSRFGLTILFISHNLAVVRQMSDDVTVLKGGTIMETGPSEDFFINPSAAYSRELLSLTRGNRVFWEGWACLTFKPDPGRAGVKLRVVAQAIWTDETGTIAKEVFVAGPIPAGVKADHVVAHSRQRSCKF